jgi:hypothetical protein
LRESRFIKNVIKAKAENQKEDLPRISTKQGMLIDLNEQ